MNEGGPGLALSRSSGGSRAANADDGAPRKHAAFHSSRGLNRKAPRHIWIRSDNGSVGRGRVPSVDLSRLGRAVDELLKERREDLDQIGWLGLGQGREADRLAHHLKARHQGEHQRGALGRQISA
jgi:hypothetical protein